MAEPTDGDLLAELDALGQPQREPEPEPAYQPIGPRLDAPMGRPDAGQLGRDITLRGTAGR